MASTNVYGASIGCVAWYGIARGATLLTYNPSGPVRREQRATFIATLVDYVAQRTSANDGPPPVPPANRFPCDVAPGSAHFASIQRLAAAGIVKGPGSTAAGECFDPAGTVTRAQMASFIANAQASLGQVVPASTANAFADDNASVYAASIDAITAEGITAGTGSDASGADLYSPDLEVRRDQIAAFLARKLDRLVERSRVGRPPTAQVVVTPSPSPPGVRCGSPSRPPVACSTRPRSPGAGPAPCRSR